YETSREQAWVPQARSACQQSLALGSTVSEAYVCAGTVALGTGQDDEAAGHFERAIELEPTNDQAVLGLARAQDRQHLSEAAERTYRHAIELRPQYWATYTWLGTFFRNYARYAEAATQYERAVSLTPENPAAHFILGGLYVYLGRYEDAISAFRRSIELGPTTAAYSNWGMTHFRMRQFDAAVSKLEAARDLGPKNFRTLANLARAYYWQGQRQKATETCDIVLKLGADELTVNPRNVDANLLVAECVAKRGDRNRALQSVRASEATPDGDPHVALFVAMIFNQLGDRATALDWLRHAASNRLPPAELRAWPELDNLRGE